MRNSTSRSGDKPGDPHWRIEHNLVTSLEHLAARPANAPWWKRHAFRLDPILKLAVVAIAVVVLCVTVPVALHQLADAMATFGAAMAYERLASLIWLIAIAACLTDLVVRVILALSTPGASRQRALASFVAAFAIASAGQHLITVAESAAGDVSSRADIVIATVVYCGLLALLHTAADLLVRAVWTWPDAPPATHSTLAAAGAAISGRTEATRSER